MANAVSRALNKLINTFGAVFIDTLTGTDGKYSSRKVTALVCVLAQLGLSFWHLAKDGSKVVELVEFFGIETLALFGIITGGNIFNKTKDKVDV